MSLDLMALNGQVLRVVGIALLCICTTPESFSASAPSGVSTYVDVAGALTMTFVPTNQGVIIEGAGARTQVDGQPIVVGERTVGKYIDCSTKEVSCIEFGVFALAIPRGAGVVEWRAGDWSFRRTRCLDGNRERCDRFAVIFRNDVEPADGGFVFSARSGVEFFFHSDRLADGRRMVYVLQGSKGIDPRR